MDEYITRSEHEEFCRRMESENSRLEDENNRQNSRITLLEETVRQINDLTLSVKEMAVNMKNMLDEQKRQGKELETLKDRDGEKWRTVVSHAITALVSGVICYMLSKFGM